MSNNFFHTNVYKQLTLKKGIWEEKHRGVEKTKSLPVYHCIRWDRFWEEWSYVGCKRKWCFNGGWFVGRHTKNSINIRLFLPWKNEREVKNEMRNDAAIFYCMSSTEISGNKNIFVRDFWCNHFFLRMCSKFNI